MALIQCIYCSAASDKNFSPDELGEILATSRVNNAALDVTGILLFEKGSFFQVLEGEADTVDELYQKLLGDSRHNNVTMIISEPIKERTFGDWSMGYPDMSMADIESLSGLNDFFAQGRSFLDIENETAKTLLDAFRKGDWHIQGS